MNGSTSNPLALPTMPIPPTRIWDGWLPLIVLPPATFLLVPGGWPRWAFMWLLALAIYAGCKWLTWRRSAVEHVPVWKQAAYLLAWPGLDAASFFKRASRLPADRPLLREWLFSTVKLAAGLALVALAIRWRSDLAGYLVGWIGMVGIVVTLHFGVFDLLSCVWWSVGIDARRLMDRPVRSVSVTEFWGRRWNRAFRDLTHRFLFRPLTARFGARVALGVGFLFSGLVHELVITVPARGGYGGPTLFFLIQGVALFVERSVLGRRLGLGSGFRGWLFVVCVTVPPVYLLFPPAFVERVIVPFLEFLGESL